MNNETEDKPITSMADAIGIIYNAIKSDEQFKDLPEEQVELISEMTFLVNYVKDNPFAKFIGLIFSKLPEEPWYKSKSIEDKRNIRNKLVSLLPNLKYNSKNEIIINSLYQDTLIELVDDGCPKELMLCLFTKDEWNKMAKAWGKHKIIENLNGE